MIENRTRSEIEQSYTIGLFHLGARGFCTGQDDFVVLALLTILPIPREHPWALRLYALLPILPLLPVHFNGVLRGRRIAFC